MSAARGGRHSRSFLERSPWLFSFAAALAVWVATLAVVHGRGGAATLAVAAQFATFYVIVGIGQMLVISAGPGNIDLSIPGAITLAAYVGMAAGGGTDAGLPAAFAAALGVGLAVGLANILLIELLAIPPMIGTLASGFVLQSVALSVSAQGIAKPPPALARFTTVAPGGVPLMAACFVLVAILVAIVLRRSIFGRSVLAIGQNGRAAWLAGLRVRRTVGAVYLISALLAALAGLLLAGNSGGASLDMGGDYLLMSIAVVVLGGTAISGGDAVVAGLWGAALLLDLLVTLLDVLRLSAGIRYVVTGLVIISVLALARRRG